LRHASTKGLVAIGVVVWGAALVAQSSGKATTIDTLYRIGDPIESRVSSFDGGRTEGAPVGMDI
jgi:hypothetical protein